MKKEIDIAIPAIDFENNLLLKKAIQAQLNIPKNQYFNFEIIKKSLDARGKIIKYQLKLNIFLDEKKEETNAAFYVEKNCSNQEEVHIIGAGPAGLFCALQCIQVGLKPILFERGKNVKDRRRDLAKLNKEGILHEESNYCFGEGGAGTYSDGKLYTRSNKRGDVLSVLQWLQHFGANEQILYEAHPHIGTNKLPQIIEAIREKIIECGGEIYFEHTLTDFDIVEEKIKSITFNHQTKIDVKNVVLATGHSAADIYHLLHQKNICLESKSFALGVRVEHPQTIIDTAQYKCSIRPEYLPPASYSLVQQINERGVFSFCMCPGGIIAPAATQQNSLVVNGWSPSKRNNPFANSGIVVSVNQSDYEQKNVLSGLTFQHTIEQKAFELGGGKFVAPAMRLTDFVEKKYSNTLPLCSYLPGVKSAMLHDVLPAFVYDSLQKAFVEFGKKIKGYYTQEAIVVATESRTSSPVRIPRNKDTFRHVEIKNLYPCAEGAGYAGGIVSAAMDGMNIAKKISEIK